MSMRTPSSSGQEILPSAITDFIVAFMRAINTARLYASGHDLFKKHTQLLYAKVCEAMAGRDFLFLGCARDAVFVEGAFYQVKDPQVQKFLKFFHFLRICHVLFDNQVTTGELGSLIGLLAGAKQGQGNEVSSALTREDIKYVRLGLLDYTIFATAQTVASQLTQATGDEAIWRQLILQPAGAGAFNLSQEQTTQLIHLCEDMDELKKLLLQMDADMAQRQQAASPAHRGMLLANFIQNLGEILSRVAPTQRKLFAQKLMSVLDTMEPQVRIQILGAPPASALKEQTGDVIHEILGAMSDSQFLGLLGDAMEQTGAKSACSGNLFNRALARFKGPAPLLKSIRQEMHRAIQEGNSGVLSHWQQIEQLLISQQEAEEFNEQYRKEIEALATSLNMKAPMVEEEEMARLLKTLTPESLRPARAHLIIDLISQPRTAQTENLVRSLLEGLGGIVRHFLSQGQFLTVGNLLRKLMVALSDYPEDGPVRETVSSLLTAEDIKAVMENLLKRCRTYEPRETARIAAICRLYPEKSVDSLLDSLLELGNEDSLQSRWLSTSLAALGPNLSRALNRRLLDAPDHALLRLLSLAVISADRNLASAVGRLLEHRDPEVRLKAVSTLGTLHAEALVPRLAEIVLEKSWLRTKKTRSLQVAAARALAEIGTDKALEALHKVISQGPGDLRAVCQELV